MKYKKTLKSSYAIILTAIIIFGVFLYANPVFSDVSDFRIPYVSASSSPSRVEVQNGLKLYQNKNSSVGGLYLLTRSQSDIAVCGGNMSRLFIACDTNSTYVIFSFLYSTGLPISHTASFSSYHGYYICSFQATFYNEMSECFNFYETEADFLDECDLYFGFTTPTPEPTPTPDPTPTPTPTQDPLITEDNNFWEEMGNTASGLWSGLTSFVAGLYSNVVTRNLAIYIPIFALIVALLVYAIYVGGGHDD